MKFFLAAIISFLCVPTLALAQEGFPGLVSFAGCSGPDCSACNVVDMANGLIKWLIGFLFIIFAIILVYRGVQLVTSRGAAKLEVVKDAFVNAYIGIILILGSWVLIDTIMRALLAGDGEIPIVQNGQITGYLLWSEVECQDQRDPVETEGVVINQSSVTCAVIGATSNGQPIYDCAQQIADCASQGGVGTVNATSTVNQQVDCTVTSGAPPGSTYTLSTPSGPVPVTACDSSSITSVSFLGRSVQVHRNLVASLQRIDARWRAAGGNSWYSIREMGGYACRQNVNDTSRQSWHAYGLAIDINAGSNPNVSKQTPCPSDMPAEFVAMFRAEGWGWGGNWNSVCDAMHFSKAINEGGNMVGD